MPLWPSDDDARRVGAEEAFTRLFDGLGEEVGTCDEEAYGEEFEEVFHANRRAIRHVATARPWLTCKMGRRR